jgi:hypothetical protein
LSAAADGAELGDRICRKEGAGAFERPDGYWESLGKHVQPRSLYMKQLEDRLGAPAVHAQRRQQQEPAR